VVVATHPGALPRTADVFVSASINDGAVQLLFASSLSAVIGAPVQVDNPSKLLADPSRPVPEAN
jgi:hypothetical protein